MIEEARRHAPPGVRFKIADAEHLPFKAGWFERVVVRMTVHLLDRPRAFPEFRRVLAEGGRAVVATLDPAEIAEGWLAPFFPSLVAIDEQRFPSADALERELAGAGFTSVAVERLPQTFDVPRAQALEQIRGRAFSTFDLIPDDELHAGAERAEAELPERVMHARTWLIAVAER
jgi:SAM-dependent methyltransferase